MLRILIDRTQAGRLLADRLAKFRWPTDTIVLALPRGGVVLAYEIANALHVPLDVFLVRKLGVPWHPELAMGAIAAGGVTVLQPDVIRDLGISQAEIDQVKNQERLELDRRDKAFRRGRPLQLLSGKTVIVVDDGVATGSTLEAAIQALRQQGVRRITLAIGVAPPSTLARLARAADDVVCLIQPESLGSVGEWYQNFSQVSDEEVRQLLAQAESAFAQPEGQQAVAGRTGAA
jgi:putative phosphoribosyl transferase